MAIERFIDVSITKSTPKVSGAGFGTLLVVTNSDLVTTGTRVIEFTTAAGVGTYFGTTSEEYKAALAYFSQSSDNEFQPEKILFGRFVDAASQGVIECGQEPLSVIADWQAITDGEFAITIDSGLVEVASLDFSSATSLDDVATVIDTGLSTDGSCIYLNGRFVINSDGTAGASSTVSLLDTVGTPAGTDISGTGYLDGDVLKSGSNPGGSILSQGQIAETPEDCTVWLENKNSEWYTMGFIKGYRDTDNLNLFATAIESRRKTLYITTNDSNTKINGNTTTFAYFCKNAGYKRSGADYSDDADLYPDMAYLGLQLPKTIGTTNWAFKTLPGIADGQAFEFPATTFTEEELNIILAMNVNAYTTTLNADFMFYGTNLGGKNVDKEGEYIDIVRNIDFLQARIEEGILNLFLTKDIVPYTDAGIAIIDNNLRSILDTYGVKQGILVEGSVVTSLPARADVSEANRDDRILPSVTFTAELSGAIDKVIIRGTVFI